MWLAEFARITDSLKNNFFVSITVKSCAARSKKSLNNIKLFLTLRDIRSTIMVFNKTKVKIKIIIPVILFLI
jgi:glutaredoxin-related protein